MAVGLFINRHERITESSHKAVEISFRPALSFPEPSVKIKALLWSTCGGHISTHESCLPSLRRISFSASRSFSCSRISFPESSSVWAVVWLIAFSDSRLLIQAALKDWKNISNPSETALRNYQLLYPTSHCHDQSRSLRVTPSPTRPLISQPPIYHLGAFLFMDSGCTGRTCQPINRIVPPNNESADDKPRCTLLSGKEDSGKIRQYGK